LDIEFLFESLSLEGLILGFLIEFLGDTKVSKILKIEKEIEKGITKHLHLSPPPVILSFRQAPNRKSIKQQTNLNKKKRRIYISNIQYHEKI
jgi:hypothetical protein